MSRYTITRLNEIIQRDKVTLIEEYDKITRETVIKYRCNCNEEYQKNMRSIEITGATCKKCIVKNKVKPKMSTCDINQNIRNKIRCNKIFDKDNFDREGNMTEEDILILLHRQQYCCYVCKEKIIIKNWKPYCFYQFSIDRLDNSKPHDRDNILISCYYCNCRNYYTLYTNKVCPGDCHTEIKNNIRRRHEVNSIEQSMYRLKR